MIDVKSSVLVIGDLVGSRRSADRAGLHARVAAAIEAAGRTFDADLRLTAGDEYQGAFPSLGHALRATLALRLALLPAGDVRHGIGLGPVEMLDAGSRIEDGPGWWAARAAIVAAEEAQGRPATRSVRTAYRRAEGQQGPDPALVDAALIARDELVTRLGDRGLSVLRGLLAGRTQKEVAESLGVSTSAVSQRVRHDGLGIVLAADELMGGLA